MSDERVPNLTDFESPPRQSLDYRQLELHDDPIGDGGQGIVYRAEMPTDTPPDHIAVKEPAADSRTLDADDIQAFLAEANTWGTVDSREREKPRWEHSEHIVGVVDTGDELPWIALEYMDGGSLADRLEANPGGLPLQEALWIGECVCRGVELAHNYGIAHLDLKPANVLFRETPSGVWDIPKISDWGVAQVLAEQTHTTTGISVQYAAPEQFDADAFGDPDMLTDVYQVGALLYTMLTGSPPYTGGQAGIINDVVSTDLPAPPSTVRNGLPESADSVVLNALETEKPDRHRSIQMFQQELATLRSDLAEGDVRTNNETPVSGTTCSPSGTDTSSNDSYSSGDIQAYLGASDRRFDPLADGLATVEQADDLDLVTTSKQEVLQTGWPILDRLAVLAPWEMQIAIDVTTANDDVVSRYTYRTLRDIDMETWESWATTADPSRSRWVELFRSDEDTITSAGELETHLRETDRELSDLNNLVETELDRSDDGRLFRLHDKIGLEQQHLSFLQQYVRECL